MLNPDFTEVDIFLSELARRVTKDKRHHAAIKYAIAEEMFVMGDVYLPLPLFKSVLFFKQIPGTGQSKLVKILVWKGKPVILRKGFSLLWRYILLRVMWFIPKLRN